MKKNHRELIKAAKKLGLSVDMTQTKHLHVRTPDGRLVAVVSRGTTPDFGDQHEKRLKQLLSRLAV